MKKRLMIVTLLLILVPFASAKEGSIKLLALTERGGTTTGTVADLQLEIQQGHERVFLETTPLTKIATQASLRFAQQTACKELDQDCGSIDFLYTIKALPGIVGGPSAGAGAAVLTAILLEDLESNKTVAVTGTINSGGIIGPVGGLNKKVKAASENGIKKVLIPRGTKFQEENNQTIDLIELGKELGVEVIEIDTLDEALFHFTDFKLEKPDEELVIQGRYQEIMKQVSWDLCKRNDAIQKEITETAIEKEAFLEQEEEASNFRKKAEEAKEKEEYYSAASFCFRSNFLLKKDLFALKKLQKDEIMDKILNLKKNVSEYNKGLANRKLTSITDIQAYMAVQERLFEVDETLFNILEGVESVEERYHLVAYAEERFYSVLSWARFFTEDERKLTLKEEGIKESCISKISEAEERYNYVKSIIENDLSRTKKELEKAYFDLNEQNYISCLYGASKAKAEADVVMSVIGVSESRFDELIDLKLRIVRNTIVNAQRKNIFPIIGYSYYEYANSLRDTDKFSALLFVEYAMELSNLDIYFDKRGGGFVEFDTKSTSALLFGISLGIIIVIVTLRIISKVKASKARKSSKKDISIGRVRTIRKVKTLQTPRIGRLRGKKR